MRRLEQRDHQEEIRSQTQSSLIEKYKDTVQRNEVALDQIRANLAVMQQRQSQQIDHLKGSIQLLQNRLQVVTPRFEEISELQKRNQELKQRIDRMVQTHANDSLSDESSHVLSALQKRVTELEKRLNRVIPSGGKIHSTPPPLPISPIPVKEENDQPPQAKENRHFMPRLRKAFASPKLPSFVVNAVKSRSSTTKPVDIVCTLPPYAKTWFVFYKQENKLYTLSCYSPPSCGDPLRTHLH